jgi:hypothetical protein
MSVGRQAGSVTGQKLRQKPTVDSHRRRLKSIGIGDLTTVVPLLVGSGDEVAYLYIKGRAWEQGEHRAARYGSCGIRRGKGSKIA